MVNATWCLSGNPKFRDITWKVAGKLYILYDIFHVVTRVYPLPFLINLGIYSDYLWDIAYIIAIYNLSFL